MSGKRLLPALLLLVSAAAFAEDVWNPPNPDPAWQKECGSCHMPFPPALLSREGWDRLMNNLGNHFGDDATLDDKTREQIALFLSDNAARSDIAGHTSEQLRITDTPWFTRHHKGALRMVLKGKVKKISDCLACHKGRETVEPD